jgi:hypothetical protein
MSLLTTLLWIAGAYLAAWLGIACFLTRRWAGNPKRTARVEAIYRKAGQQPPRPVGPLQLIWGIHRMIPWM